MARLPQTVHQALLHSRPLPTAPAVPLPKPPARRRPRILLISAIAVALLVSLAAVLLAVYWPYTQNQVTQSLQETFGGTVSIGHFRGTHFPHPGAVAENVALRWQDAPAGESPLIFIKKLTIQTNYANVLLRHGYISRLLVEGLRVYIPPRAPSPPPSNEKSKTRIGEVFAQDALLEIPRHSGESLQFAFHSFKLTSVADGQPFSFDVFFNNPVPPGEIHARGSFGPWNTQAPAQTPASGKYFLHHADLGVFHGIAGLLWSEGEFQGTLGQLQARGSVDIPDFQVTRSHHAVPLKSEYRALVNATNGDVTLQRVNSTILQTKVAASGTVAGKPGQHGKTASIDLDVNHGRIQDVLRMFVKAPRPPLHGDTSFHAHVTIPPGPEPFLKKVTLAGDFGISGGHFTKPETQQDIAKLSESGAGKKSDAPDKPDPADIDSQLSGQVVLQGGVATFSDFSFGVPDAKADMHGTYNLVTEAIDLHGLLRTTAKLSNTTSGLKSVLLKPFDKFFKRKHHNGAKVPVQLTGTYDHPHAATEILKGNSSPNSNSNSHPNTDSRPNSNTNPSR